MNKRLTVGIMGLGVVGGALYDFLLGKEFDFRISDPEKDFNEEISEADVIFICVPVPTKDDRTQDLSAVESCILKLKQDKKFYLKPVFLKSTVLPGTCDDLSVKHFMKIYHMPEFLTERRAIEDMQKQEIVCGGKSRLSVDHMHLVMKLFDPKKIHFMSNTEAEIAKYAHNAYAAAKVNFFNIIYSVCLRTYADYESVIKGASITGFIGTEHLQVPGPDGRLGYGGKCLPKDLKAFIGYLEEMNLESSSLRQTEAENDVFRRGFA
jgi:nucleotide sugar dehydrogenase